MSLHFEWTLSLRLRSDASASFLDELRFRLGLSDRRPDDAELEYDWPCLTSNGDDALPGGDVRSLVSQQPYPGGSESLGLFVRTSVLDDAMYELIQTVPVWLARWALTQGWIGQAREEMDLRPWLNFYVQDGYAYAGTSTDPIMPLNEPAPAFTLTQTTDHSLPLRGPGHTGSIARLA